MQTFLSHLSTKWITFPLVFCVYVCSCIHNEFRPVRNLSCYVHTLNTACDLASHPHNATKCSFNFSKGSGTWCNAQVSRDAIQ